MCWLLGRWLYWLPARDHRFHSLRRFMDRDFFDSNRYIFFSTVYGDYVFEVFSVYTAHISFPYIYPNYDHMDGGWEHWVNAFAEKSIFDTGISVSAADRVLTLSTCDIGRRDYRIVVQARLVETPAEVLNNLGIIVTERDSEETLFYVNIEYLYTGECGNMYVVFYMESTRVQIPLTIEGEE